MISILILQGFLGRDQLPARLWLISEKFRDRLRPPPPGFRSSRCGSPATSCNTGSWLPVCPFPVCALRTHCVLGTGLGPSNISREEAQSWAPRASAELVPHFPGHGCAQDTSPSLGKWVMGKRACPRLALRPSEGLSFSLYHLKSNLRA